MNRVDPIYLELINYIMRFGVEKQSRTGKVKSVFGFQFRHYMRLGFPILTTKEINFKSIVAELLWSLNGNTNIKFLIENGCDTWTDLVYDYYINDLNRQKEEARLNILKGCTSCNEVLNSIEILSKEDFCKKIVDDSMFAKQWGELGPITGHQWRSYDLSVLDELEKLYTTQIHHDTLENRYPLGTMNRKYAIDEVKKIYPKQDQILNLLNALRNTPDSRRLIVDTWNIYDIPQMILPPAIHSFQIYTRPLMPMERMHMLLGDESIINPDPKFLQKEWLDEQHAPERAISLMWNQRSADVPVSLPYNISYYALLLVVIGHIMNMVPEHLIGNLGDCHIYENQQDIVLEQMERDEFLLPKLKVNSSVWKIDAEQNDYLKIIQNIKMDDFILDDYQFHPAIKIPTNI